MNGIKQVSKNYTSIILIRILLVVIVHALSCKNTVFPWNRGFFPGGVDWSRAVFIFMSCLTFGLTRAFFRSVLIFLFIT